MAKAKNTNAVSGFNKLYAPAHQYETFVAEHSDKDGKVKGDLGDLLNFWAVGSKRVGIKPAEIQYSKTKLIDNYLRPDGDRTLFFKPGNVMYSKDITAVEAYAGSHGDEMIDATDVKSLREMVLPYAIGKNYHDDTGKFKDLEKLVKQETKLKAKVVKIQNKDTREEAIKDLVQERETHYDTKYADNDDAREILKELISESAEVNKIESDYAVKNKELDEALGKDIKPFLKSLGIEAKDLTEIYAELYIRRLEEAMNKQS